MQLGPCSAASARQSPPSAIASATSSTVLPRSWIDRAARHDRSCRDSPMAKPLTCAVCISSDAPVEEISNFAALFNPKPTTTATLHLRSAFPLAEN